MRLQLDEKRSNREPDLQVILNTNPNQLNPAFMNGAADIVIEVVSPENKERDYGEKFHEYEQAGVREYWIIDPIQKQIRFYRLSKTGTYILQEVDNSYQSPLLPKLKVTLSTLWQANFRVQSQLVIKSKLCLCEGFVRIAYIHFQYLAY